MSDKHKLSFIGPQNIHEAFSYMDDSWDMQTPIETMAELEEDLNKPDGECQISKSTSVFIIFSRLFDSEPERFARDIAFLCPYAVCCILIPSMDLSKKSRIEEAVRQAQYAMVDTAEGYDSTTPFYFCLYEQAQDDILKAIDSFVGSNVVAEEVKESIRPLLPISSSLKMEQYDEPNVIADTGIDIPQAIPGAKGKVITVTSSKGGSGKSTVSILTGSYIALSSKIAYENGDIPFPLKVCIVDLDVRDGQLGILMGSMKPTVVNIVMAGAPTPENIRQGIFSSESTGCDFIFASRRPRNAERISAEFYAEMIQNLRSMYDYIILDTSVNYLDELLNQVAYPLADRIVLVSDMGISSILGMRRWISETLDSPENADNAIDRNKIGIVINKAMPDVNMTPQQISQAADGIPVISMVPSIPILLTYAANTNQLSETLKQAHINQAIRNIAIQVVDDVPLADIPTQM